MGCSKILKATKVNGIYDNDPNLDKNAKLIRDITYSEVISKNLRVMDLTAISLAKESGIPIYITSIFEQDSLIRTLKEEGNYSKIH
jgi:uridylate kinase